MIINMLNNNNLTSHILIGLVQMAMADDPDQNLVKAISGIREAKSRGADIICLPELFRSPYFCVNKKSLKDYSEPLIGDVSKALSELAKELQVTIVGGSIYEKAENGNFNTALVFGPDGSDLGCYRKTHIPHDPAFYEQNYFKGAENNYKVFTTTAKGREIKFGVLICYDQWFPEAARSLAIMGAEIIFYPTAIGTINDSPQKEGDWHNAWRTVQCGHAVANATIVAAVNRVGQEGTSNFWGGSFVCDAFGRVLAEGTNDEQIIVAPIDVEHNKLVKEGWRFFKERRPDTYNLLVEPIKDN
jgi:predicted amidohydrolase